MYKDLVVLVWCLVGRYCKAEEGCLELDLDKAYTTGCHGFTLDVTAV